MEKMLEAFNEIQEDSDNRERKEFERSVEKHTYPWDILSERDRNDFEAEVLDLWNSEQYKERNPKDEWIVRCEVWERWDKDKIDKI